MEPRVTIVATGPEATNEAFAAALRDAVGGEIRRRGPQRGAITDAVTYLVNIVGPAAAVADRLISLVKKLGSSGTDIKIVYRGAEFDIKRAPRDQVISIIQAIVSATAPES